MSCEGYGAARVSENALDLLLKLGFQMEKPLRASAGVY